MTLVAQSATTVQADTRRPVGTSRTRRRTEPGPQRPRLTEVKRFLPVLAAVAVVAVAGSVTLALRDEPVDRTATAEPQTWTGTAPLLQTPDGVLTLCGGPTLDSLPPAGCSGAVVRGVQPMDVEGAVRYRGGTVTTPSVRVVGTWDGTVLTATEPPVLAERTYAGSPVPEIPGPSCPEPDGGWPFDRVDLDGIERVSAYVQTQPEAGTPRIDPSQRILTTPFTGDLDRHRHAIAELYDGPVCVELAARSDRELQELGERLQRELEQRGLVVLSSSAGGSACGCVTSDLVAATPEQMAEIESSYDGLVRLTSFLEPE